MEPVLVKTLKGPNPRQTREVWQAGESYLLLSTLDLWSLSMKFQHLLGPEERFETMVLPCDADGAVEDVSEALHRERAGDPAASHDRAFDWLVKSCA